MLGGKHNSAQAFQQVIGGFWEWVFGTDMGEAYQEGSSFLLAAHKQEELTESVKVEGNLGDRNHATIEFKIRKTG